MDGLDVDRDPREHRRSWRQSIISTNCLSHASNQDIIQSPERTHIHSGRYYGPSVPNRDSRNWRGGFSADDFHRYEQMLLDLKPITDPPVPDLHLGWNTIDEESQLNNNNRVRAVGSPADAKSDGRATQTSAASSNWTEKQFQLPQKRQARPIRAFRHTLWNVYKRLFSIVFAANATALVAFLCTTRNITTINLWNLATAASANIFIGTSIRQDYVQGILYRTAWLVPHSAPLKFRRIVAKIYENGGIHSGCGVAGTFWFIALTTVLSIQFVRGHFTSRAVLVLTFVLQGLLLLIVFFAYPSLRFKSHNTFEMTHRFAGWTVMALFWVELGLLADATAQRENTSIGRVISKQPAFWFLVLTTVHTILPWINLRRWEFEAENLSNHAVRLHFQRTLKPFTGIAISRSPLFEWHPFATMPSLAGDPTGGSLIVSAAGDWTKDAVANPRRHYWVKGTPKPGVLSMSLIFKRVVIVTTGSGIGPCLSIMVDRHRRNACRVLWSSPSPEKIFGTEIVDAVRRVDPLAVIVDSRAQGRPDMVALTYRLYVEAAAEAVFVISNPMLTRKIVYGMEARGVPAFGPVWDS